MEIKFRVRWKLDDYRVRETTDSVICDQTSFWCGDLFYARLNGYVKACIAKEDIINP